MPTLIVQDLPDEVYERLQRRAAASRRSIPDEAASLLREALKQDATPPQRVPDLIPSEEIPAPCDLPRYGYVGQVQPRSGGERWPDPVE